jgi:hypothetical protein
MLYVIIGVVLNLTSCPEHLARLPNEFSLPALGDLANDLSLSDAPPGRGSPR